MRESLYPIPLVGIALPRWLLSNNVGDVCLSLLHPYYDFEGISPKLGRELVSAKSQFEQVIEASDNLILMNFVHNLLMGVS
jgi:hypothetical protein